jgi:pyruvate/2-oxoglutarate/acetoin dehydrogenase E1 component
MFGDIAAMLTEEANDDLDSPIMRICGKNTTIPYSLKLEKACVPSTENIIEGILELV